MINISPSALKTFLACPRSWFLQFVAKVPREVPSYVTAGTALDVAVQNYLKYGTESVGADGEDAVSRELAVLKAELPAPKTVLVQERFRVPCPGYEGRAQITTGGLDYMTPPNAELMVIGDLKRIWHQDAAMTAEQLADDVQAQMYAWLLWQTHAPLEIIWRWTYCVRAVVSKEGKVTRKAKAFSVDVKADRKRVDDWFDRVVLQAARDMLDIIGPAEAIAHDPDSCENGGRCFVRAHCALHQGPVKGDIHVDLSRFKTNAAKAAEAIVAEAETTVEWANGVHIAINPPPLSVVPSRETDEAVITVDAVEGPGAELLEAVPDTVPAPAPDPLEALVRESERLGLYNEPPVPSATEVASNKRRERAARAAATRRGAPKTEPQEAPPAVTYEGVALQAATTESILDELRDRGYTAIYLERARG